MSVTLWNTVTVTQTLNMNTFVHLIPSSLSAPRNLSFLLQSCFNSLSVNYSWELTSVCSGSETSPPLLSRQTRDTSSLILRQTSTSFHPIMWVVLIVLMVLMVLMVFMVVMVLMVIVNNSTTIPSRCLCWCSLTLGWNTNQAGVMVSLNFGF